MEVSSIAYCWFAAPRPGSAHRRQRLLPIVVMGDPSCVLLWSGSLAAHVRTHPFDTPSTPACMATPPALSCLEEATAGSSLK